MEKPADDPHHHLTDGRVTIIVSPWAITDYSSQQGQFFSL